MVKVVCANNNSTTMLRVGTKDNAETLRARLKKRMEDISTYDIWLPNQSRMPEHTHLEYHGIKEKDILELKKKTADQPQPLDPTSTSDEISTRPGHKKRAPSMGKSEGGALKGVFGRLKNKEKEKEKDKEKDKERDKDSLLPPPVGLPPALAQPLVPVEEKEAPVNAALVPRGDDKRKTKIWGRDRTELLTSFFKNRPDKDELVAKKILVQDIPDDLSIPLNADVVSRTIEWLEQQPGICDTSSTSFPVN